MMTNIALLAKNLSKRHGELIAVKKLLVGFTARE